MFNGENKANNLKLNVNDFSFESEKSMQSVNKVNVYATKNKQNVKKTVNVYDVENSPAKNSKVNIYEVKEQRVESFSSNANQDISNVKSKHSEQINRDKYRVGNIYDVEEERAVNDIPIIYETENNEFESNFENINTQVNSIEEINSQAQTENSAGTSFEISSSEISKKKHIRKSTIIFIFALVFGMLVMLRGFTINRENEIMKLEKEYEEIARKYEFVRAKELLLGLTKESETSYCRERTNEILPVPYKTDYSIQSEFDYKKPLVITDGRNESTNFVISRNTDLIQRIEVAQTIAQEFKDETKIIFGSKCDEMNEAGNYLNKLVVANDNIETPAKREAYKKYTGKESSDNTISTLDELVEQALSVKWYGRYLVDHNTYFNGLIEQAAKKYPLDKEFETYLDKRIDKSINFTKLNEAYNKLNDRKKSILF